MIDLLQGLNDEQKEAVTYDQGSLLVLAGAGSGKTRVITHRFAYLIRKHDLRIHNILCVTFTNKAAGEMKERIGNLLGVDTRTAWVRTFHSMCAMILREHAMHIGFSADFTIYDTADTRNTIKKIMERLNIDPKTYPDKAIIRAISTFKEELISFQESAQKASNDFERVCAEIYMEYQRTLKVNQAMDFADLITNTIILLENTPEIRERYQRQWHYIMADEFQDTNRPQYRLLDLLSRERSNVCVVGDDDQSIYAWRGARVENIYQFQKEFHAHIIRLEKNYRSYGNILEAANSVVKSIAGRMPKTLKAERENGPKITLAALNDDRVQASFVYEEMEKLLQSGNYKDFAILYRMNAQSRIFEEILTRHQIPYKVYGGVRFFDRAEIKDILSYLRILVNPQDAAAFERIVNIPKRKIGDKGKEKIAEFVRECQLSFVEACTRADEIKGLSGVAVNNLKHLGSILCELSALIDELLPLDLLKILLERIGYKDYLIAEYGPNEAEDRFENIQELVNAVKVFEELNPDSSIADFLREASLLSSGDESEDNENAVSLMTIHSAKGLEFPTVFVVGMAEGVLPLSSKNTEELDEEKRLFYVATTRAMNKLFLSYEKRSLRYGEFIENERSHFLDMIPQTVLDEKVVFSEPREASYIRNSYKKEPYSSMQKMPVASQKNITNISKSESYNAQKIQTLSELAVGDKIIHNIFGIGVIEYLSSAMIRVNFEKFGIQVLMGNILSNIQKII